MVAGVDVASDSGLSLRQTGIPVAEDLDAMLEAVDAVYISASIEKHREYIEAALRANCMSYAKVRFSSIRRIWTSCTRLPTSAG